MSRQPPVLPRKFYGAVCRARRARSINSINNSCVAGVRRAQVNVSTPSHSRVPGFCGNILDTERALYVCGFRFLCGSYAVRCAVHGLAGAGRAECRRPLSRTCASPLPADQRRIPIATSRSSTSQNISSGRRAARGQWHCMGGLNDTWPPDTNLRLHETHIVDKLNTPTALVN